MVNLSASPVNAAEFLGAFSRQWQLRGSNGSRPENIGLAISGGVDSMALAVLCSSLQKSRPEFQFKAFVVDHGVRKGSADEARAVSEILLKKGIPTDVLRIEWPVATISPQSANFESLARKFRFQALGKACQEHSIRNMLVAHHEDDQVETVLMRLLTGRRRSGLAGIKGVSGIPECYGIHGVYESGQLDEWHINSISPISSRTILPNFSHRRGEDSVIQTSGRQNSSAINELESAITLDQKKGFTMSKSLQCESGGVKLLRPLLQFSKARLKATCEEAGMPWFEDHTNHDPTITVRNAIRNIRANYTLPKALQKPAIIALSAARASETSDKTLKSKALASRMHPFRFEPRVGTILAGFEPFPSAKMLETSEIDSLSCHRQVAAHLLRNVIRLVSPEENFPLASLAAAVGNVFPELTHGTEQTLDTSFTLAGVHFKRQDSGTDLQPKHGVLPSSDETSKALNSCEHSPLPKHQWFMSRQPYHSNRMTHPRLMFSPLQDDPTADRWQFYDGRYWIRIRNRSEGTMVVRPFLEADLKAFQLEKDKRRILLRLLKELAPGAVRRTLPVIVLVSSDGEDRVLSLPTLEVDAPGIESLLEYEVRYKKVDDWVREKVDGRWNDEA